MRHLLAVLAVAGVVSSAALSAAEEAQALQPVLGERGKVLFADEFERAELGAEWSVAKGTWVVAGGALKGEEKPDDNHAAVVKHKQTLGNFVAQVSFRFDGGKSAAFSLNGKGGHICRVLLTPKGLTLKKDKPNKNSDEKGATLGSADIEFKPGEWYTLQVEVAGSSFAAQVTGQPAVRGEHAGVAAEKLELAFPVAGAGVSFDNLKIWELTPKAETK